MTRDLLVLTNALTDLVRAGTDEEVARRGLRKGHAHSNDDHFRESDLNNCRLVHGGSPGNVAAGAAHLGLACGLIGSVGTDEIGRSYVADIAARGIESHLRTLDGPSGVCWVLVTPDGERTMAVDLGVSPDFSIPVEVFPRYRAFHCSGYEMVSNPEATWKAIETARREKLLLSFDVADAQMVRLRPDDLRRATDGADVVFANEHEARAITEREPEEALVAMSRPGRQVVVKLGARGSLVWSGGKTWRIPSRATKVVDTTGAGDAYAAGFLSAFLRGAGAEECGVRGTEFAARICAIEGARLPVR
ncbi:MAG: adenosine kinase [Planctomycetes bacterium]|nr:adenosine kinase [Planctomycetota bacterium]